MHQSAYDQMALCVERYMKTDRKYDVLDLGARVSPGQTLTHRQLLTGYSVNYTGIDPVPNENVDIVMEQMYTFPVKSRSTDILISGQVFEHIPFVWVSMLEIARVLRYGGYAFITAPSRGHTHSFYDCWRYYPDSFRALAAWSGLELREAYTDFPPATARKRFDYKGIDVDNAYWGDSVGVFQKTGRYPLRRVALVRLVTRWWANRLRDLDGVPKPKRVKQRELINH